MKYQIRLANQTDAAAIATVLRSSIEELCHSDHFNNEALLAAWLADKDPASVSRWIAYPGFTLLLAVAKADNKKIVGVGGFFDHGKIMLNYVAPLHRFQGVSGHLLKSMEDKLVAWGVSEIRLNSTKTAEAFYRRRGYIENGDPQAVDGRFHIPLCRRF